MFTEPSLFFFCSVYSIAFSFIEEKCGPFTFSRSSAVLIPTSSPHFLKKENTQDIRTVQVKLKKGTFSFIRLMKDLLRSFTSKRNKFFNFMEIKSLFIHLRSDYVYFELQPRLKFADCSQMDVFFSFDLNIEKKFLACFPFFVEFRHRPLQNILRPKIRW